MKEGPQAVQVEFGLKQTVYRRQVELKRSVLPGGPNAEWMRCVEEEVRGWLGRYRHPFCWSLLLILVESPSD